MTVIPSSKSVEVTFTAKFTTMVTGVGSESFTYQWRHNGVNISRATGDILMINNVNESDGRKHECIVTNQFGNTNSYI